MIDGGRELLIGIDGGGSDTVTYLGVLGDTEVSHGISSSAINPNE